MIDHSQTDHVELSIAAQPPLLQLARLTAGVVAARADLDLNDVEDLRLAVDELCLSLMGPLGTDGRLLLRYGWDAEMIEISCTLVSDDGSVDGSGDETADPPERGEISGQAEMLRQELSSQILDALVDAHGETENDGHPQAWLRMRRIRPDEG